MSLNLNNILFPGSCHGAGSSQEGRSDPECQQHQPGGSQSPGGRQHPQELRGRGQYDDTILNWSNWMIHGVVVSTIPLVYTK